MTDLEVCRNAGPPATVEELTKFLLIAPEKAAAMRAELRAIKKAGLAAAVYQQKQEEQRQLAELILDASVLMGEMAMNIRKASGGYRRSENFKNDSAVAFEKSGGTNGATERPKSKVETIRNLGFSKKQVERFETLADNKDLVEKEKAQAREEGRMPTRTRVIDMAQARKKSFEQNREQIDADAKIAKDFVRATHAPLMFSDDLDAVAAAIWRNADGDAQSDIEDIDLAIRVLSAIKMRLMQGRKLYGSA